ncbi:hypothetical protein PRZ48_002366 [Zasmidium cellare]|uniref:Uncharacterized protein n=1 Tax=Zasmidium cellare TaxID=395010 RepID=A0ABR0F4J0_ZASCE|nr:hypothetical protein PRZ48_002366 [Zasmidium cellare]
MSATKEILREATHAGSWYTDSKPQLSSQLDGWLDAVQPPIQCIGPESEGETVGELPVPGARVIIAPKRIFLLGPSHHYYLTKAALSRCAAYETPLGNLPIDRETTAELHATGQFEWMSQSVDEDEHSLEMHLPYIYKILSKTFGPDPSSFPPLTPIMIGNTSASTETALGALLAPYLQDPTTAFVISSDFAHWGLRFRYTYYRPTPSTSLNLTQSSKAPSDPPIHESIKTVDFECMGACEGGKHREWLGVLERTGNTVCGRHPIGVVMAALEEGGGEARFRFVRYERSSEVKRVGESSVSYASAFAVL